MGSRNERLVERFYEEMWNRFDTSVLDQITTEDVAFRGSLGQTTRGRTELATYVESIRAAFPDFHNQVEELVSEEDRSFAKLMYSGTHWGDVLGVAPTGRQIEYAGAALFTVRKDRIESVWVLGDVHGLHGQLLGKPD